MTATASNSSGRRGGTLIEVMVACVVLAIMAIVGSSYVFQSQSTLSFHRDRSLTVAVANSRMEELRGTTFADLTSTPSFVTTGTNWVKRANPGWTVTSAVDYDSISAGSMPVQLRTALQVTNISGGEKALIMTVRATCRSLETEILTTLYAP